MLSSLSGYPEGEVSEKSASPVETQPLNNTRILRGVTSTRGPPAPRRVDATQRLLTRTDRPPAKTPVDLGAPPRTGGLESHPAPRNLDSPVDLLYPPPTAGVGGRAAQASERVRYLQRITPKTGRVEAPLTEADRTKVNRQLAVLTHASSTGSITAKRDLIRIQEIAKTRGEVAADRELLRIAEDTPCLNKVAAQRTLEKLRLTGGIERQLNHDGKSVNIVNGDGERVAMDLRKLGPLMAHATHGCGPNDPHKCVNCSTRGY